MSENIALFDEYAARILGRLYETHPVPQQLNIKELLHIQPKQSDTYDRIKKGWETFVWLRKEGFICCESQPYRQGFRDVSLSAKGLAMLQAPVPTITQTMH